ncbi:MAG: hypothetical protein J6T44_00855 [Prevotella sp.]|nr:hypothetical protein [Prevotella sp.]
MTNNIYFYPKNLAQLKAKRLSHPINSKRVALSDDKQISPEYMFYFRRHPFMYGIGSLGNISGGYSRFRVYFRGNYVQDMRKDWMQVGDAFRESFKSFKR